MAQLNITLNQDEVLRILEDDGGDAFRLLLQESLNAVMRAESDQQLKAAPYERCEERTDSRNGVRERPLVTRIGTINLKVPRHRNAPFKTLVFDNYSRGEAALVTAMAEMVVNGVSTAKVGKVMEAICGKSFSKQAVSEAAMELDAAVDAFRNRPLPDPYLFVMADATYLKVREEHRVVSKALMVAVGMTPRGTKEIIAAELADAETAAAWEGFADKLKGRGLHGVRMFTSDAHEGLASAFQRAFPDAPWQRCQAHFARNIAEGCPKRLRAGLRSELAEMFNCRTIGEARRRRDEIVADYADAAPRAVKCLDDGFDDAMTVMELPEGMRRCTRTSNILERLNKEVKRRSNVIGVFPNAASATRLMGAVLMEEQDRWVIQRKLYYKSSVKELEDRRMQLVKIAKIQCGLRKAA